MILSRARIESFLACPRQFQLRYRERRPWPNRPLRTEDEAMLAKGQLFHQLLQRHFAGLPPAVDAIQDDDVCTWWRLFQQHGPAIPDGAGVRLLPEMSLTIPVPGFDGRFLLTGRFDLLVISDASAHIFDWKTGRPRPETELRHDWQTRLYLALLAEGGPALSHEASPEQIAITYWFVRDHQTQPTITYSLAWHAQNWADIQAIAAQIAALADGEKAEWPLTEDWAACRRCAFQIICGRQTAGVVEPPVWEYVPEEFVAPLEPEIPQ